MAKRGTLEHPKTKRLARLLGVVPGVVLGLLETIWHFTGDYRKDGGLSTADIEDALDSGGWLSLFSIDQIVGALHNPDKECVWLDRLSDGRWFVHDWPTHREDGVHATLFRAVQKFANGQIPKPRSMSKDERARLDAVWKEDAETFTDTAEIVNGHKQTSGGHTENVLPFHSKPYQAIPFHSMHGPEIEEVICFAQKIGRTEAEARAFHAYYAERGWKAGEDQIRKWEAVFRAWTPPLKVEHGGRSEEPRKTAAESRRISEGGPMDDGETPLQRQLRIEQERKAEEQRLRQSADDGGAA